MSSDEPAVEPMTYDAAITEVEEILSELESSVVDVDRLAQRVARASTLLAFCRSRLAAVHLDVEQLVAELDASPDPGVPDDDDG